jgi:Na+/H+-dicarboxylate symporter
VAGLHLLRKLYVQVVLAVVAGAFTGYLYPHVGVDLKPFGDGFIKAIRVVITPVIFTTVVTGLTTMGDIGRMARVGLKAVVYFEVMSTLALIIGLVVGNVWPVGTGIHADVATLDPQAMAGYDEPHQQHRGDAGGGPLGAGDRPGACRQSDVGASALGRGGDGLFVEKGVADE